MNKPDVPVLTPAHIFFVRALIVAMNIVAFVFGFVVIHEYFNDGYMNLGAGFVVGLALGIAGVSNRYLTLHLEK